MLISKYSTHCPICGSCENHIHYLNEENEWKNKCVKCNESFDDQDSLDFEWDWVHYNWIYELGGKPMIIKYIRDKINGEVKDIKNLDLNMFNYSCYLLFGVSGKKILENGKSFLRDIDIQELLD